jgi:autotransporter-associated beta strand protein/T5SS/PEP-CTERM-associated repeat protein
VSVSVAAGNKSSMKRSLPLAAVLCAALILPIARGRAQDLYVGSNAANVTTNFTSGTNLFQHTFIGFKFFGTVAATNNVLNVSGAGTLLTNSSELYVGFDGRGNSLVISNGGKVASRLDSSIGVYTAAPSNSVLVTGANSLWTSGGYIYVGNSGSSSRLVISNGGGVSAFGSIIGYNAIASSNSTLVTGSNSFLMNIDWIDVGRVGSGNSLTVSNGGRVEGGSGSIGLYASSSGNSALVTGTNSRWYIGDLNVGSEGSGNSLVIANGGEVRASTLAISAQSGASNNSVSISSGLLDVSSGQINIGAGGSGTLNVTGGTVDVLTLTATNRTNSVINLNGGTIVSGGTAVWTGLNAFYVGDTGSGATFFANGGQHWFDFTDTVVGNSGSGNSLVISNGGLVYVGGGDSIIGYSASSSNNSALVTGSSSTTGVKSSWSINGETLVGREGSGNSLVISNGGRVVAWGGDSIIGFSASSSNNTALVTDRSFWTNAFNMVVGNYGSGNSLVIANGGEVFVATNLWISAQSGASNNSVSISSGLLDVVNGTIEVGRSGSGALNVSGDGIVEASNIVIAASNGSAGTLNIGRFGTNDSAGTISAATIAFGAGTGVVNFNQSNAVTITSVISGAGTVRQLGSGTTTLSASNTYTGSTTISAGTLELDSAGWVAGSISNNATLSLNRTNTLTLTNLVSGTGALSKSGTGTVILAAANTYSGNTTISAGTLQINAGGSVSNSATTLVGSGGAGTLSISGGTYSNTSVSIGHSGGTGILNLNSGSLSAQNLAVSGNGAVAGTLNLNGGTMAVSGSFSVASGGTINVNTGGVLRGGDGGQLSVGSTNSLINFNGGTGSSGLNIFVGNGGTVDLRGQSLGSSNWGNLVANGLGGVLRNSGTNAATIANQNTIWLWEGGQRLTIDASGGDILINSWITSSLMNNTGIIKTGTNALILANSENDYNGGSFLQQGTLRLDHANAAGSGAITQSNAGSTLQINAMGTVTNAMSLYNIATLQTVTLSGAKTLNGAAYNVAAGTTTTESGVLSGAGGLTKSGTGTMTLSASNTYTGDTAIGSGALALTNGSAIADTAAVTNSGATLRVDSSETIGSLRGSGSTVLNGMAVTLTIAETNSHAYAGVISGAGGFAKTGGGTTTLAGSNTYSGDTTVGGGRLAVTGSISGSNAVYVGNEASGNSLIISNGGRVANGQGSIGYTVSSSNNSALVTGANSVWTNSGILYVGFDGRSNSLVVSGGGTVASQQGYIGGSSVSSNNSALVTGSGSLWTTPSDFRVGREGDNNSLTISNGGRVASANGYIGTFGNSSGNSALVTGTNSVWTNSSDLRVGREGSGNSLTISNGGVAASSNSYIGSATISSNNSALVTGVSSLWTNSGALYVGEQGASNTLTVANGAAVAATNIVIAASNTSSGTLNIGRFGTNDAAGTVSTPTIAFGAGTGVINFNQSNSTTLSAAISGNGALKQLGTGTTTLSASNTYIGDTTISAGTLRFSTENSAGRGRITQTTLNSLVEFLGGGRMTNQMTAFQYSFAESFEAAGQVTLADAASSISVASGKTVTGSGQFTGTGGLTKNGLGTLLLTASNNFSGPVAVQSGLLNLNASSGAAAGSISSVSVASGATLLLSRSDQVNNGATVSLSGGTIRRGGNVGEVFGNLNLTQASFLDFGSGAAGNLTFGTYAPSALLTVNNFLPGNTLVFGSDLRSSITNSSLFSFTNGGIGSSSWDEGTSTFTITAIPEPSTYVAAIGLLALMLWPLRRRWRVKVS